MSSSAQKRSDAVEITGGQRLALWILGNLLKLWGRTIKIEISAKSRATLARRDEPVAMVLWHNRLFMAAEIIRRIRGGKSFHGIISASKDGGWLVGFFKMFGIKAIRGSSSWGAREAVTAMINVAKEGGDLGITPDGPKGPIYDFKPGGLIIARRAKLPMILVGIEFSRVKQLGSWDRFMLPLPFSTAKIRVRQILPADLPRDRNAALTELSAIMTELNGDRH